MKDFDFNLDFKLDLDFDLESASDELKESQGYELQRGFLVDGVKYSKPTIPAEIPAGMIKTKHAIDFVKTWSLPAVGSSQEFIVPGSFVFGDIFEPIMERLGGGDIVLSTLSLSEENIDMFERMMEAGTLKKLSVIVSDYFYIHERSGLYKMIVETLASFGSDRFEIAVAGVHTKITMLDTPAGRVLFSGSANLRSSASLENFTVSTIQENYEFHHQWHIKILEAYGVIKKSIRVSKLWKEISG